MKALYQKIRILDGKPYGLYKSLAERTWDFGDFVLEFIHVQGDPYAPPSRVLLRAKLATLGPVDNKPSEPADAKATAKGRGRGRRAK